MLYKGVVMNFSDKVKFVRNKLGLSQKEFADKLNVSFATINRWEQGTILPHKNMELRFEEFSNNHNIDFENKRNVNNGFDLITARQIENWFSLNQRSSQELFPELIKKLICESAEGCLKSVRFPIKDKINLDGFDIEVEYDSQTSPFIPFGKSVWELGATVINPTQKIKQDYKKRTNHTPMAQKQSSSFVLITPKSFKSTKKTDLLKFFTEQGWKSVKIYDAVDLEFWLSQCVATSIWLFEKFTNEKIDIKSFKNAYTEFMSKTTPELTTSLFTTKREEERQSFLKLCESAKVIKVSGASFEESFGFVMSVIKETENEDLFSKIIVCNNYASMKKLDSVIKNKILILTAPVANHNISENNQFIFIFGRDTLDHNININLQARPQSCLTEVLKNEMKVPAAKLNAISHKAKNNIMLIMREIENETSHTSNEWRSDPEIEKLIPILLVGKADLKNDKDKEILSLFLPGKSDLNNYISYLKRWEKRDNSPIFFYGDNIKVCLKEELWASAKDFITPNMINLLTKTIKDIFKAINPKFELPVDKRIAHQIYQKVWPYNKHIVTGLLDSCILLTIYNNKQTEIDLLIRDILSAINNPESLLTVSDFFSLLAECSPDEFLSYLEKEIKSNNSLIFSLFSNNDTSIILGAGHDYCSLLWALELLTHLDDYKVRACNILMMLKLKNFHYKISNCPKESLLSNLHWINQKNALTFDNKKNIVIKFLTTYKNQAFDIPLGLIESHTITLPNIELRWRTPDLTEENITYALIYNANEEYIRTILNVVDPSDVETVKKILDLYFFLTKTSVDDIEDFVKNKLSCDKAKYTELYEFLLCKRYSVIKYSKSNKDDYFLKMCDNLIKFLKPKDLLSASLVYFKFFGYNDCPLPEIIDEDFDAEEKKTRKFQKELFNQLYEKYDHKTLIEKISAVLPDNGADGYFFAQQKLNAEDKDLFIKTSQKLRKFSFLSSFTVNLGKDEFEQFINKQDKNFIIEMIPFINNLEIIPKVILQDEELTKLYYSHREMHNGTQSNDIKLIKLYNPMSYIRWLLYHTSVENWDIAEIISVLNNINENQIRTSSDLYYLREIFSKLDQNFDNYEILKLEIKFLNIFEYDEIPNAIKKYLFDNPEEYIDLINSINSDKININFWYKLNMHMSFPFNFENASSKLDRFISTIMNHKSTDATSSKILKNNLGSILARSFGFDKEYVLPEGLKNIIEKLADEDVNKGIILGYENMRGFRTVTDGTPELKLSEQYALEAERNSILFPESSKILKSLAKNRKFDAERDKLDKMILDGLL